MTQRWTSRAIWTVDVNSKGGSVGKAWLTFITRCNLRQGRLPTPLNAPQSVIDSPPTWRQVLGSPLRSWQNLRVCQLCARVSSWIDMHKNSQWLSVQFVNSDNWCLCVWSDVQVQSSAFLFSFLVGLVGVELLICFVVFPGLFVGCCCCFLRLFYQLFNHHHHHHPNPPLLAPALRLVQFLSSIIGI